ncbi:MAG: alanine racemase [Rhizobiaceae bacterium]|nr:alanine racemase [Rhizobiaceae bacterium]
MGIQDWAPGLLSIDLDAIASNYRYLKERAGASSCAAVVKADAYGLGAPRIAQRLREEGCGIFFVAHLAEGLDLRAALGADPEIYVLNGTPPGAEGEFLAAGIVSVVNNLQELNGWRRLASTQGRVLPVAIQVDTGMSRLGLAPADVARLHAERRGLEGLRVKLTMSHLACAEEPARPANQSQLEEFVRLRRAFPSVPASLANSSGIFLGPGFHFDIVRAGAALYGINPVPGGPNPMRHAASLKARVLQIREVPAGAGVGYGLTARLDRPRRLATLSLGYADGWLRGNTAGAWYGSEALPAVGRVSMDSMVVDVTAVPVGQIRAGCFVDLIGPSQTVDQVAAASGTIGYEVLCRVGRRIFRSYSSDPAS